MPRTSSARHCCSPVTRPARPPVNYVRYSPLRHRAKFPGAVPPASNWPSAAKEMAKCSPNRSAPSRRHQDRRLNAPLPRRLTVRPHHRPCRAGRHRIHLRKDEEIYGEDEPAEYVYQVISGAVRSYKLLSDGRRQIGAFHLPGDVFGLESGTDPSAGRRSHHRHHRATGEAPQPGAGGAASTSRSRASSGP